MSNTASTSGEPSTSSMLQPPYMKPSIRESVIQLGHHVLIKLPNGDTKSVKLDKNAKVNLGKTGTFESTDLVGHPYGLSYEILPSKKLVVIPPKTMEELEDTDATNELITDGQFVQPLTMDEIAALKESGLHASEIIKRQIENHSNYALRTEYSKDKYKKRKEAKYAKTFSTVEPTLYNVCDYWFTKDRNRLRDLRVDALSHMLNLGNVRPGGRYIVVDDASGMLVCGVLERMGGQGRLMSICNVEGVPAYPVLANMNFSQEILNTMEHLNWGTADENYNPIVAPSEPTGGEVRSERQQARLRKRKAATDGLLATRDELFAGEFDALLVASEYSPHSIIEKCEAYLGGSASIVIHSMHLSILAELQTTLRYMPQFLGPTVTEPWTRPYQVLPGRTHPHMNTSGTAGYLLHAIKIYDDPTANSVVAHRDRTKKTAKIVVEEAEVDAEAMEETT